MMLLWLLAMALADEPTLGIEGSAWRLSPPLAAESDGLRLHLFTGRGDCENAGIRRDVEACLPRVDRATGTLRFGFEVVDKNGRGVPLALSADRVGVRVDDLTPMADGDLRLVGHEPRGARQLFVLVIDGSSSMYAPQPGAEPRIVDVIRALQEPRVVQTFFPGGEARTGVILLRFTTTLRGVDGTPLERVAVVTDEGQYRSQVDALRRVSSGFTHLYDAVDGAVTKVVRGPEAESFLSRHGAEPTVVVLTDGFNNTYGGQRCGDNAWGLNKLIRTLLEAQGPDLRFRPTVFTVGFGIPYRPAASVRRTVVGDLTREDLCGVSYVGEKIDGQLEDLGIDNVSLAHIAAAGGGRSYVARDRSGLADIFAGTGAVSHRWYALEARGVPEVLRRRSFTTHLQVRRPRQVEASIELHPHAWLDGPTADVGEELVPRGIGDVSAWLASMLGALLLLAYGAPAWMNLRRALWRRSRRASG